MKVSNETKIGALTAISITLLILGFNFLKGKSLFKTGNFLHAKFADAKKLNTSDPVYVNGLQVGSVYETHAQDETLKIIIVDIKLNGSYQIPDNSVAAIDANPLGGSGISITLGNSKRFAVPGDTLPSSNDGGLLGSITNKLAPVADQLRATLSSLDTVLRNVNTIMDPSTKGNLQSVIASLSKAAANIVGSTASLQNLLDAQTGSLAKSLDNMNSFTKNLADNNDKVTHVLANMDSTTAHLAQADIQGIVSTFKASATQLNALIAKANSTDGSIGALINSKDLYNNINNSIRSLNTLMDDLRVHPKRYVNISVFGKKDKGDYLTSPLKDSTNTPAKP